MNQTGQLHQTTSPSLQSPLLGRLADNNSGILTASGHQNIFLSSTISQVLTRHQRLSFSPLNNPSIMPPLPQSVIDKFKNSEFVNFDLLLPNRSPLQSDEYTFKVIGGDTSPVALAPNNQKKPKVTDFSSWMVAWNNFVRCYTIFHPHRLHELLRYQSTICDFASQYNFAAWSQYDRMFCYQLVDNHGLSWH